MDLPYSKTIPQLFKQLLDREYIADIKSVDNGAPDQWRDF